MSTHSTYDLLRHLADSWGLVVMSLVFVGLIAWPFRPGTKQLNRDVARMILSDDALPAPQSSLDPHASELRVNEQREHSNG